MKNTLAAVMLIASVGFFALFVFLFMKTIEKESVNYWNLIPFTITDAAIVIISAKSLFGKSINKP